jgi:hypothetical protein
MSNEQISISVRKTSAFGHFRYIPDCPLSKTIADVSKVRTFTTWQLKRMQEGDFTIIIESAVNNEIE